jgi:hypothetical protein
MQSDADAGDFTVFQTPELSQHSFVMKTRCFISGASSAQDWQPNELVESISAAAFEHLLSFSLSDASKL